MNWLITGGCGFLGTALIRSLMSQVGHNVRIVDNLSTGTRLDLASVCQYKELTIQNEYDSPSGVELVVGDILDAGLAVSAARNIDIIVHFAANTGVGPSVENPRTNILH